jgi:hypothetical protein
MLSDQGMLSTMQLGSARMVEEWLENKKNIRAFLQGLNS